MSQILEELLEQARGINRSLALLAQAAMPAEPNYRYPFEDYPFFDWSEIGAEVIVSDEYGATAVRWNGHVWKRRNWSPKFGMVVGFSRPDGMGDDGVNWLNLIVFQKMTPVEPLDGRVAKELVRQSSASQTPTPPAPTQPVDSALFEWRDRALAADTVARFVDCMVRVVGGDSKRGWIDGVVGLWSDWSPTGSNVPMVTAVEAYCKDRANAEKAAKPLAVAHKIGVTSAMGAYNRANATKKEVEPA